MAIDELHFTWDSHAAARGSRYDAAAGKPPGFDEYIDFLEQFDWRGEVEEIDHHIDKQFVLPAEPGD